MHDTDSDLTLENRYRLFFGVSAPNSSSLNKFVELTDRTRLRETAVPRGLLGTVAPWFGPPFMAQPYSDSGAFALNAHVPGGGVVELRMPKERGGGEVRPKRRCTAAAGLW